MKWKLNEEMKETKIEWNKIERDFSSQIKHLRNKCTCQSTKCPMCIKVDGIQELWNECELTVKYYWEEQQK